jgi:hypothetical protein
MRYFGASTWNNFGMSHDAFESLFVFHHKEVVIDVSKRCIIICFSPFAPEKKEGKNRFVSLSLLKLVCISYYKFFVWFRVVFGVLCTIQRDISSIRHMKAIFCVCYWTAEARRETKNPFHINNPQWWWMVWDEIACYLRHSTIEIYLMFVYAFNYLVPNEMDFSAVFITLLWMNFSLKIYHRQYAIWCVMKREEEFMTF